jgi:phosphoserine aminotransferase
MEGNPVNVKYNFNPGPSALPREVLERAEKNMFNYNNSGMSVMEMSHRSSLYEEIHYNALNLIRKLLSIPDDFTILFMQGGASLQFAMLPLNFRQSGRQAAYVLTGSWSEKAFQEASRTGSAYALASSGESGYRTLPSVDYTHCLPETDYIHFTSNNTIFGTQWGEIPQRQNIPLFIDASSDIFSRQVNWKNTDLLYAGAQKNAGPAGVTIVVLRNELLRETIEGVPHYLNYSTHQKADSLYNTPPALSIYMLGLMLDWVSEQGGTDEMVKRAEQKAGVIYRMIDSSNGFYKGYAMPDARSKMNVTFNLRSKELEEKFLQKANDAGFAGLAGHRSVGGCRASLYNGVPHEHAEQLADFMEKFQRQSLH